MIGFKAIKSVSTKFYFTSNLINHRLFHSQRSFVKNRQPSINFKHFKHMKVSVLGASGGIGQPLSLLLTLNNMVDEVCLYDVRNAVGVGKDLSHIDVPAKVTGYSNSEEELKSCLQNSNVVLIPAGVPRKPGMTRDDLFNTNASIVYDLSIACAKYCPNASILIISNPVNSTVPICSQIFKKNNLDTNKIYGVTTLDLVRASKFISDRMSFNGNMIKVPVIGGHSGETIVPLFSQINSKNSSNDETQNKVNELINNNNKEYEELIHRVQFGGDEVVKAKEGTGSATLSMAYAGAKFAQDIIKAIKNNEKVDQIAFVKNTNKEKFYDKDNIEYISTKVIIDGDKGVKEIIEYKNLTNKEKELLEVALKQLQGNVNKGKLFVESKN